MSITVRMFKNGQQVSLYGRCVTHADVLEYFRGWVAPAGRTGDIHAIVEAPQANPQRFELRYNGRHMTMVQA